MSHLFRDLKVGGLYRLRRAHPHPHGPPAISGGGELVRLTPGNLFLVLETRLAVRGSMLPWAEILMGSKIFKTCLGPNDFEPVEEV